MSAVFNLNMKAYAFRISAWLDKIWQICSDLFAVSFVGATMYLSYPFALADKTFWEVISLVFFFSFFDSWPLMSVSLFQAVCSGLISWIFFNAICLGYFVFELRGYCSFSKIYIGWPDTPGWSGPGIRRYEFKFPLDSCELVLANSHARASIEPNHSAMGSLVE